MDWNKVKVALLSVLVSFTLSMVITLVFTLILELFGYVIKSECPVNTERLLLYFLIFIPQTFLTSYICLLEYEYGVWLSGIFKKPNE